MKETIESFYRAFGQLDAEAMVSCYHADVIFEDPVFGVLTGEKACNMWRMLCHAQRGKDFRIVVSDLSVDGKSGRAHWEVFYPFAKKGRRVHNVVEAHFEFEAGRIIRHTDQFALYRWARQALGVRGILMGWTGFFRKKLRNQVLGSLQQYEEKQHRRHGA